MSKRDELIAEAMDTFGDRDLSIPAQAEAAMILKTAFRLTRQQIATVLGISLFQAMRRLNRYKFFVANGDIPSTELAWRYRDGEEPGAAAVEAEEERLEKNSLNREANAIIRADLFEERIAEACAKAIAATVYPFHGIYEEYREARKLRPKSKGSEEVAMGTISDLHTGLENQYFNVDTAHEVIETYMGKIIRLTDKHRTQCEVKKLVLNLNGDNVQGSGSNYANQRWDTTISVVDQVEEFTTIAVRAIQTALVEFDEVEVNCQYGNHGYLAPKSSNQEPDHANYETLAHRAIAWAFRGNERVKVNVGTEWFQLVTVMGQKFFLTHGHEVKGAGSLDGIVAVIRKWQDILPDFDHVIMGHFHRYNRVSLPRVFGSTKPRTLYLGGTAVLGDTFIQKFGAGHTNEYWFKFVNSERVTAEYAVELYN